MYDITKRSSFLSLQRWIEEVRRYTASNVMLILVGRWNRCKYSLVFGMHLMNSTCVLQWAQGLLTQNYLGTVKFCQRLLQQCAINPSSALQPFMLVTEKRDLLVLVDRCQSIWKYFVAILTSFSVTVSVGTAGDALVCPYEYSLLWLLHCMLLIAAINCSQECVCCACMVVVLQI